MKKGTPIQAAEHLKNEVAANQQYAIRSDLL